MDKVVNHWTPSSGCALQLIHSLVTVQISYALINMEETVIKITKLRLIFSKYERYKTVVVII